MAIIVNNTPGDAAAPLDSKREPPPLVIVEGFLGGFGTQMRWGDFQNHWHDDADTEGFEQRRRAIFISVGPVSSLHDRACEIFYALVGGAIDYGRDHTETHGHGRFGRTYAVGLYPEWSKERPLHFLGHSFGGPTIIKLQWLLKTGFFGEAYSADMVLSVNTVSAPFRGTSIVYLLGEKVDAAPAVRFWSIGSAITKIVHVASYFSPWLSGAIDFHTESRGYSFREASFWSFLKQLWRSDWGESRDIAPFDCTFEASDTREAQQEGAINPNTYYRSYAASWANMKTGKFSPPSKDFFDEPVMYHYSFPVASFDFSVIRPVPSFLGAMEQTIADGGEGSEVYRENDGVVPLFSQWHPFACQQTTCQHFDHPSLTRADDDIPKPVAEQPGNPPEAGKWHVYEIENAHHATIAPVWLDTSRQRSFWKEMGQWLRDVDAASLKVRE